MITSFNNRPDDCSSASGIIDSWYEDVLMLDDSDDPLVLGDAALPTLPPIGRTKYCLMPIIYKRNKKHLSMNDLRTHARTHRKGKRHRCN